jgi:hypothetical protein
MRITALLALAAVILAVIVTVAPAITPMYDEASVYSMDFQPAAPAKVAGH